MKASTEETVKRLLPFIPTEPPDGWLETIQSRGYLRDPRLLYGCEWVYDPIQKKKVRRSKVTCTECGGEAFLEYVESGCGRYGGSNGFIDPATGAAVTAGNTCICPSCGRGTTAMRRPAKGSSTSINDHVFMSLCKLYGNLALLSWVVTKLARNDGTVIYRAAMCEGALVIDRTLVRIRGYSKYMTSLTWLDHWEYTKRFDYQFGTFDRDEVIFSDYSCTDGTDLERSGLVPYLRAAGELCPTEYIKLWLKYPNTENLVTAGYEDILNDVITDASGYYHSYTQKSFEIKRVLSSLDLTKARPTDILGIEHEDIPIAKRGSMQELAFYKKVKARFGVKLSENQLLFCKKMRYSTVSELWEDDYGHEVRILHLLGYLLKQRDLQATDCDRSLVDAQHLRDYWRMLHRLYGAYPAELLYPKDLRRAHDEINDRITEKENEETDGLIRKRAEELARFTFFSDEDGLFIRPAGSHREFINEGKKLSHCVARYAGSHAAGTTNIFFIRKIEAPDEPYYTLELSLPKSAKSKLYVIQNRGRGNCARTDTVKHFEGLWLNYVESIINNIKKEKNDGKRNDNRIGA
jgi:hypothetical protein